MDFYEVIKARRSVRAYRQDPVDDETLERVLSAAVLAPSAGNRQPIHLYVVREKAARMRMMEVYRQEWFVSAPVIICACHEPGHAWKRTDGKSYADVDLAIAFDHLILAATAEGLGTCWIGAFKAEVLRAILDIPDNLEPVALTPLGYPAHEPSASPRRSLDELVEYR